MSGSTFGNIFKITTWGESHGSGIGVVIDGCPAGLTLNEADIQAFLDRRKPGSSRYTTQRKESDSVEILSGIFEGKTTGTPISMFVRTTVLDMQTLLLTKNMDLETTAEAGVLLGAKLLVVLQQVLLLASYWQNLIFQ